MKPNTALIPGLPDDVAVECLARVPFDSLSTAASVSIGWKAKFELPEFHYHRKTSGLTQSIIVMAQARVNPKTRGTHSMEFMAVPIYRLVVCDAETGHWSELPSVPGFSHGLPLFCQLVGVGLDLVIMGGYNPVTWEVSSSVFVYNFVSAKWRRGDDMPGGPISLFGSASNSDGIVFIAGGHDQNKNALNSAMIYDVTKNQWTHLPDMTRGRDECKVVFHGSKFYVIGGYNTERQGRFEKSAETFDVVTRQWAEVDENFLAIATCPRTCVGDGNQRIYMCLNGNLVTLENTIWQVISKLPIEIYNVAYLTSWKHKLLLIGSPNFGQPHRAYVMDLRNHRWKKLEAPEEYSGQVQSGGCLEI